MSQELLSKVTSRNLREALSDYFSPDRDTKERGIAQLLGLSGFNPWDAQLLQVYGVLPSIVGPEIKLPDQSQDPKTTSAKGKAKGKTKGKGKAQKASPEALEVGY